MEKERLTRHFGACIRRRIGVDKKQVDIFQQNARIRGSVKSADLDTMIVLYHPWRIEMAKGKAINPTMKPTCADPTSGDCYMADVRTPSVRSCLLGIVKGLGETPCKHSLENIASDR